VPTVYYGTVHRYKSLIGRPGTPVRPMLPFRIVHLGRTTQELFALVDSGADVSTFHVTVAALASIDLASTRRETAQGLGGVATTYVSSVILEVEGRRFPADVHSVTTVPPTVALLGRRDVFRQFRFGFDERASKLLVEPYS